MNIAFLAHDKKKELMVQFCTAYKSVLAKHNLFGTATPGRLIADNTGLPITLLLSHKQGGHQQINARIAYNEIDLVLLFTDPNNTDPWDDNQMLETIRHCDKHNGPIATNLGSAEMFVMGLQLLGVVPEDANVVLAAAFEKPLIQYTKKGAAAACGRIAQRIKGYNVPLTI